MTEQTSPKRQPSSSLKFRLLVIGLIVFGLSVVLMVAFLLQKGGILPTQFAVYEPMLSKALFGVVLVLAVVFVLRTMSPIVFTLLGCILAGVLGKYFEHGGLLQGNFATLEPWIAKGLYTVAWCAGIAFLARLVNWLVWDGLVTKRTGVRVPALLRQVGLMLILSLGAVGMLSSVYGISLATLVTASGALGIVIGLAFKDILSDFFSGVVLNLEQPFVLDEWIGVGEGAESCIGCVKEINWRGTRLLTSEGNLIVMRNGQVLTAKLTNFSRPSNASEFEVELCFPFSTDRLLLESVLTAAVSEAQAHQDILAQPEPKVMLKRIDSAGLTYILTYCINLKVTSRKSARSTVLTAVARHLRFNGLEPAPNSQIVTIGQSVPVSDPDDAEKLLRIRQLQQIELLRSLTEEERVGLASKIEPRQFSAGESVVRFGEDGSSMFVVISGHLEVAIPSNGEGLVRVATLGPGDVFGEMSLLTGASRTATVIPLVPSYLYEIKHEVVGDLIEARPALADELSRIAAERRLRTEAATTSRDSKANTAGLRASLVAAISQGIEKFFVRRKVDPK